MNRWILPMILVALVVLIGCATRSDPTTEAPLEPVTGSAELTQTKAPALGHIPVSREKGDWSAGGKDPADAAISFVLAANQQCDCEEMGLTTLSIGPDQATVKVRLNGLKDDSVRNMEYLITLKRVGELWRVESATYTTECGRSTSPEGFCS